MKKLKKFYKENIREYTYNTYTNRTLWMLIATGIFYTILFSIGIAGEFGLF